MKNGKSKNYIHQIDELVEYADLLYKYAYTNADNSFDAEDLVQETYLIALKAIKSGKEIKDLKSYLLKIIKNRFYEMLRKKYKMPMANFEQINWIYIETSEEGIDLETDNILNEDSGLIIRKELAHLSRIYREVMVLYYMNNMSINEIATKLDISKGTVLSRLDVGRKKIKERVIKMDKYDKFSYEPIRLRIGLSGIRGINNEPINVINNLIDQNILALAYNEPLTITEISEKLGVAAAFVEEAVENLVVNEFMGQKGNKFFTDFLIIDEDTKTKKIEAQKEFANETFNDVKDIFYELHNKLKSYEPLSNFNDTQLFLFTVLNFRKFYFQYLMDTLNLMKHENFPERPNNGKWVICCEKVKIKTSGHELAISGLLSSTLPNGVKLEEYDTTIGRTHLAKYSILVNINERVELLYAIHTEKEIDPIKLPLIHDFKNLGLITDDKDNRKKLCIPVISVKEYEELKGLIDHYGKLFIEKIGERLTQFVKNNVVNYPKQIRNVSNNAYLLAVEVLPLVYAFKAADDGVITIDNDKNYPIMILIENK